MTNKQYWADASTRNCVWLFQVKCKEYPHGCNCGIYDEEGDLFQGKTDEDCECFFEYWRTEGVFLTKEEAREHGEARPYAWGKENEGWRIYGVQAHGIMVELLGQHNKEFEDKVEYITEYAKDNKEELLHFKETGIVLPKKRTDEITKEVREMRKNTETNKEVKK